MVIRECTTLRFRGVSNLNTSGSLVFPSIFHCDMHDRLEFVSKAHRPEPLLDSICFCIPTSNGLSECTATRVDEAPDSNEASTVHCQVQTKQQQQQQQQHTAAATAKYQAGAVPNQKPTDEGLSIRNGRLLLPPSKYTLSASHMSLKNYQSLDKCKVISVSTAAGELERQTCLGKPQRTSSIAPSTGGRHIG